MAIVGYARVSTTGQSLDVQLEKLNAAGCARIYSEKLSGLDSKRPELRACLDYVREGDTLIITKLDRLARSTLDLHRIVSQLHDKNVIFHVLDQSINTSTNEGRLLFSILAAIAQFETEIRAERQREGVKRAQDKGVKFGRKPKIDAQQIEQIQAERLNGALISDLMKKYNISKASVYRCLNG